jgi:iron complex outermembrane recepter protein
MIGQASNNEASAMVRALDEGSRIVTNTKGAFKARFFMQTAGCAIALASGLGTFGAAQAQSEEQAANAVTEVVITAERRVQNLQSVPISATVLNADQLAQQGVNRVTDLQQIAPSITVNLNNRSFQINIRGIGLAATAPTSSPGVAYYFNGSLIPHEQTIGGSFYDIDSVQILRGPQGTLTGQNSTAGAIYITTPKPQLGRFTGHIDQTFGDYDWRRTEAAVNLPLGKMFALRLSGVVDRRDSFTDNIGPSGRDPGNLHYDGARADLMFKPSDSFQANLRYEYFRNATDWIAIKNRNDLVTPDPFTIEEDGKTDLLQEGSRSELEARWDFVPGVQLRWNSNYQYALNTDWADGDRTATATTGPPQNGRIAYGETEFNTLVNELNLISTSEGPLEWVVGAFDFVESVRVLQYTFGNDRVEPTRPPTRTTRTKAHNRSRSIFGQVTYRFSPQWQVIAGARYSKDRQAYDRVVPLAVRGVAESDKTTGRIAINFNATERTLLYASLSKGYKAGGVNLGATDPNIAPETNVVGELGAKTTLLDGRLRINGDVFYSDYKNLQLGGLTAPPPLGTPTFRNVPKSKSYGIELEAQGVFGPWRFNLGGALLKAKTDSDAGLSNSTGIGPTFATIAAGTGLPFSPHRTFNAGVQYELQALGGSITPRLQYSYQSASYSSMFRNANSFIDSRGLLDARITYQRENWRLEGFVTNLTDKTYVAMQISDSSSLNGGRLYGAPRQVGVRLTYRYD